MNKKSLFFISLFLLILFEFLRVYLIMPMPGSQRFHSIELAYFLGSNKILLRSVLVVLNLLPGSLIFFSGIKKERLLVMAGMLVYGSAFYTFNYEMEADQMFLQPTKVVFKGRAENKVKEDKLVITVDIDGIQKAYPIQFIGYHHQV
ncbi:MAG: hypothetical protein ACO263_09920, partial [Cyclobacteriaceae bacterium]